MRFSWDPAKARRNFLKHGVSFERATLVWDGGQILEYESSHQDEPRREVLGEVAGVVLFVVYTQRDDVAHIISARRASRKERRRYGTS